MAQRVGYWQDDVTYTEGPFVMVNAFGWRIEVDQGGRCPVLLDGSIYDLLRENGKYHSKTKDPEPQEDAVDWLNAQVKAGNIVRNLAGAYIRKQT